MTKNGNKRSAILLVALALMGLPAFAQSSDNRKSDGGPSSKEQSAVSAVPDADQFRDRSVPVVVRGIIMSTDKEYRERAGIRGGTIENRSSAVVRRIRLYWFATVAKKRGPEAHVFDKGETEFIEALVPSGSSVDLEFLLPKMNERIVKWSENSPTDKWFAITIGIAGVQFENGSVWKAHPQKLTTGK